MNNKTPLIWLVVGDKPGDNAQIDVLAEALQLPYEVRRLIPKAAFVLGKPRYKISLAHLDPEKSDPLEPPWPDLIITIGRRPSMAALWIQEQSDNPCKIVLLGRPKRWFERFSLIITPPQYQMPNDPKIVKLALPLMRINTPAIETAADQWNTRLSILRKPLTAVMLGGPTKPYQLNEATILDLLDGIRTYYPQGSLYFCSSRRTPEIINQTIKNNLPENANVFKWTPEAPNNPYLGLLALADRFIVTGDSVSMMVEIARLGKPLVIYELPIAKNLISKIHHRISQSKSGQTKAGRSQSLIKEKLQKLGLAGYSRDLTAIHKVLYSQKLAAPFKEDFNAGSTDMDDGTQTAVSAIRRLLRGSGPKLMTDK
ncbi:MAG: ELM1/GtrOC1 family putative glycosyltransferase [Gammaproteobacteria bacterium]